MPIVVDRDERQAQVVAIAFDLVADRGIEALTFREIAAAAGCSTSIVSHYFGNKSELLFCIYQVANQRALSGCWQQEQAGPACRSGGTDWSEESLDLAARRLLAAVAGIGLEACFAPDELASALVV